MFDLVQVFYIDRNNLFLISIVMNEATVFLKGCQINSIADLDVKNLTINL